MGLCRSASAVNFYTTDLGDLVQNVEDAKKNEVVSLLEKQSSSRLKGSSASKLARPASSVSHSYFNAGEQGARADLAHITHSALTSIDRGAKKEESVSKSNNNITASSTPHKTPLTSLTATEAGDNGSNDTLTPTGRRNNTLRRKSKSASGKAERGKENVSKPKQSAATSTKKPRDKKRESCVNIIGATTPDEEKQILNFFHEGREVNLSHLVSHAIDTAIEELPDIPKRDCKPECNDGCDCGGVQAAKPLEDRDKDVALTFNKTKFTFGQYGGETFAKIRQLFGVDMEEFNELLGKER